MGLHARYLAAGLTVALTTGLFAGQAGAQSILSELMMNNSIIHPDGPVPPEVEYSFSDDALQALAGQGDAGVIVHHGKQLDVPGFASVYSHTERLDFFTPQPIDPATVSTDIVRAILAGNITNWREIGGGDQPITVYRPAQDLKKQAIAAQLRRIGIEMQVEGQERASYAALAQALEEDPGAFVMGLRSQAAWEENLPDARRIVPVNQYGQAAFAMPIHVYVKPDDPAAQTAARELMAVVSARAELDRMAFPVAERLQVLKAAN